MGNEKRQPTNIRALAFSAAHPDHDDIVCILYNNGFQVIQWKMYWLTICEPRHFTSNEGLDIAVNHMVIVGNGSFQFLLRSKELRSQITCL